MLKKLKRVHRIWQFKRIQSIDSIETYAMEKNKDIYILHKKMQKLKIII